MKEKLFKFLFGDKPMPERMPECLFCDEWVNRRNHLNYKVASFIVSLVPEWCLKENCNITYEVASYLNKEIVSDVMKERELEPLRSKDDFIRFLCEYILEEGGER